MSSAALATGGLPQFPGSPSLDDVVAHPDGEAWASFRRTLAPRFGVVWREIGVVYAMIAGGFALTCVLDGGFGHLAVLAALPVGAGWLGYWFASLMNFKHEAAHYNVHPDKSTNDVLANWLICPLIGQDIKRYRSMHWRHHLHLGSPNDTEIAYHNAPTPRFFLETLTGLYILRRLLDDRSKAPRDTSATGVTPGGGLRCLVLHGIVVGTSTAAGLYGAALVWCVALAMAYPCFATARQLLRHRALDARRDVNYTEVHHGAVNRMFGTDLFSRTFGSAGFNRHLLHHWDPAVSYTRFDEMEAFLMRTRLAPLVDAARTTYLQTLRALLRADA